MVNWVGREGGGSPLREWAVGSSTLPPQTRSSASKSEILRNRPAGTADKTLQRPPKLLDGDLGLRTRRPVAAGVARTSTVSRKRAKFAYLVPKVDVMGRVDRAC